jgi:hypothetical protein
MFKLWKETLRNELRFAANAPVKLIDALARVGRYMKLIGPVLQPDISEKQTSLDR